MRDATSFLESRTLEGAQIAYTWRLLESAQDTYDLDPVRDDLAFLTSRGKRLFVQLQDVSFSASRVNVPPYLMHDPRYNGGVDRQYRIAHDDETQAVVVGWVARRWDPAVQARLHKLMQALGREFDGRIEGINLAETSVEFGASGALYPPGFTPERYRDAIVANMKALKGAFPRSVAMQYGNFMPGERRPTHDRGLLRAVYLAAMESRVGMGGPDLLPGRRDQCEGSYPLLRDAAGVVPTGIAVQEGNYAEVIPSTGRRMSIPELAAFASDVLMVDYLFWSTEEPYYSSEVIPYFASR